MRYVEDRVEFIKQEPGVEGMFKMMELAARTCYKTEDLIKEGSARKIIETVIIPSGHTSVLEFGTVYLKYNLFEVVKYFKYIMDRYSRVAFHGLGVYVTTTYRTIMQGNYKDPVEAIKHNFDQHWKSDLQRWCEPTEYHHKRYCYRFVMDRVGSQSVERHRGIWGISYAQESTRYVNYNRKKFDSNISFSIPSKFFELVKKYQNKELSGDTFTGNIYTNVEDWPLQDQLAFLRENSEEWNEYEKALKQSEETYMKLVEYGWKPEDARGVLNLDIKTEFMMSAYKEDWKMWLFRRLDGHAHPHIQKFAKKVERDISFHK